MNKAASNLRFLGVSYIINDDTLAIIEQAIRSSNQKLQEWPRAVNFPMSSEEGRATLGSANGISYAWLLWQHMDVFPCKIPKSVDVFNLDEGVGGPSVNLIFRL